YIQLAVRLATNHIYRRALQQKILKSKHLLYHDISPVRYLEEFINQVVYSAINKRAETVS
ncbi:MAG: hypothetical protein WBA13_23525, partial [Microcoleaceae cyanobacterium]